MSLRHAILAPVLGALLLGAPIRAIAAAPHATPMVQPWGVAIDYIDPTDFFGMVKGTPFKTAP